MADSSDAEDPFPLIHLSPLDFTINTTTISSLPSSSLLLSQFSPNYDPSLHRQILREFRKRREVGRESIGQSAEMGIFSSREIRELDYWPRIECMSYDFDVSAGVSCLTSAQLLILVWKLHADSNASLSEDAEDEFVSRRERDFGCGISLEVIDDSMQAVQQILSVPASSIPPPSPTPHPPRQILNSTSTKFQTPIVNPTPNRVEAWLIDLPPRIPTGPRNRIPPPTSKRPIASTSKLYQSNPSISATEREPIDKLPLILSIKSVSNPECTVKAKPILVHQLIAKQRHSRDFSQVEANRDSRDTAVEKGLERNSRNLRSRSRSRSPRRRSPPTLQSIPIPPKSIPIQTNLRLPLEISNSIFTLVVMNLPFSLSEDEFMLFLSSLGSKHVGVKIRNKRSNLDQKNAFLAYESQMLGEAAGKQLNGRSLRDSILFVVDSRPATRLENCWNAQDLAPDFFGKVLSQNNLSESIMRPASGVNNILELKKMEKGISRQPLPAQSAMVPVSGIAPPPRTSNNPVGLLPESVLKTKFQLFVSNIDSKASPREIRDYFNSPGLCGIKVSKNSHKYSGLASWLLFSSEQERDSALKRFEWCVYPRYQKGGAGKDSMYLWMRKGEDASCSKKLGQILWHRMDYFGCLE